mmetsp:Transcript_19420/g.30421  ORF Transcript_19420/g.30421 Transcript_19420/m.30421 type:complete len:226 (-) Transcript_19420:27-704(-)
MPRVKSWKRLGCNPVDPSFPPQGSRLCRFLSIFSVKTISSPKLLTLTTEKSFLILIPTHPSTPTTFQLPKPLSLLLPPLTPMPLPPLLPPLLLLPLPPPLLREPPLPASPHFTKTKQPKRSPKHQKRKKLFLNKSQRKTNLSSPMKINMYPSSPTQLNNPLKEMMMSSSEKIFLMIFLLFLLPLPLLPPTSTKFCEQNFSSVSPFFPLLRFSCTKQTKKLFQQQQ